MTTVAWDGKEMAADSQATNGTLILSSTKIFKADNYIMAFTGSIDEGYMFKAILDEEIKTKDCRFTKGFCGLVWQEDGTIEEYFDTMVPVPVEEKYCTAGSGSEIALAALMCGKSAREAVELAKKLDIYTGGKVISYSWKEPVGRKGKKKKNEQLRASDIQESVREIPAIGEPEGGMGGDSKEVHRLHPKTSRKVWLRTN